VCNINTVDIDNLERALTKNNEKLEQWTNEKIKEIETLKFDWSGILPVSDIPTNIIFMIPYENETENCNVYNEYVYDSKNGKWEILGQVDAGSVQIEAYTEEEITNMVNSLWQVNGEIATKGDVIQ